MPFCANCGNSVHEEAVVCVSCGVPTKKLNSEETPDTGGFGWGLLGFCIPIIGLVLYLIWKNDKPITAKAVGTGALIGFILGMVGVVFI